jgi:hypothetical protein
MKFELGLISFRSVLESEGDDVGQSINLGESEANPIFPGTIENMTTAKATNKSFDAFFNCMLKVYSVLIDLLKQTL